MRTHKIKESFFDKEIKRPGFKRAFKTEKKRFALELQVAQILDESGWTYEEFAKRTGTAKSHVCRDLKGGLHRATVTRIERMAKALHMRYYPLLIPENKAAKLIPQIMHLVGY